MTDGMHFSFLLTGAGSLDGAARSAVKPESGSGDTAFGRLLAEQHSSAVDKPLSVIRQEIAASEKNTPAARPQAQLLMQAETQSEQLSASPLVDAVSQASEQDAAPAQADSDDIANDITIVGRQSLQNADGSSVGQAALQPAQLWLGLLANATDHTKQLNAKAMQAKLLLNLVPGTEPEYRIGPPDLEEDALLAQVTYGADSVANGNTKAALLAKNISANGNIAKEAAAGAKTVVEASAIPSASGQSLETTNTAVSSASATTAAETAKQLQQATVIALTRPEDKPFTTEESLASGNQSVKALVSEATENITGAAKTAQADKTDAVAVKDNGAAMDSPETKQAAELVDVALRADKLASDSINSAASVAKPLEANAVKNQSLNGITASNVILPTAVQAEQAATPLTAAQRSAAMQASGMSQQSRTSQDSGLQSERQSARKTLAEALVESKTSGTETASANQSQSAAERQVNVSRVEVSVQPSAFLSPASAGASAEVAQIGERMLGSAVQQTASQLQANQLQSTVQTTVKQQLEQLKQVNLLQQEAAGQLRERVSLMVRQQIQVAEIRLDPAELGQMQIRVNMQQAEATVQFIVQQQHAKELLEQQMPRLREMLQQQGIALGEGQVQQEQGRQASHSGQKSEQPLSEEQDESFASAQSLTVQHSDRIVDYYA